MVIPILFIVFGIALDQWTKYLAVTMLKGAAPVTMGPLRFVYAENTGAAFSSFENQRIFLIIVSSAAIVLLIGLLVKNLIRHRAARWGLYAIIAGAFGNLIDRIRLGYVVDMIEFTFMKFAVFNVADCFVTVGTLILVIYLIFARDKDAENDEVDEYEVVTKTEKADD